MIAVSKKTYEDLQRILGGLCIGQRVEMEYARDTLEELRRSPEVADVTEANTTNPRGGVSVKCEFCDGRAAFIVRKRSVCFGCRKKICAEARV